MVRFDISDCLVFLSLGSPVLLVVDVSVTAISYMIASMSKTLSKP
jgi:hypothetical protein